MATISVHHGSEGKVHRDHNIRTGKVVEKQKHIDQGRSHLNRVWVDRPIQEAYREIFGEAVEKYNEKQRQAGRPGRQKGNYLAEVRKDPKVHEAYECIVAVCPESAEERERFDREPGLQEQIVQEYLQEFIRDNPHIQVIGAYWHADETGEPHMHLDYIPVATGYKNGMETRVSLSKALEQQGYEGVSSRETAQMKWQSNERDRLEKICNAHGVTVSRGKTKREHLETEVYKLQREKQHLEEEIPKLRKMLLHEYDEYEEAFNELKADRDEWEKKSIEELRQIVEDYDRQQEQEEER